MSQKLTGNRLRSTCQIVPPILIFGIVVLSRSVSILAFSAIYGSSSDGASPSSSFPFRSTTTGKPIDPSGWPHRFPAKEHCSKCGLCESSFVMNVTEACPFLGPGMARIDDLEQIVHGRRRNLSEMVWSSNMKTTITTSRNASNPSSLLSSSDEARFGVLHQPIRLAKGNRIDNAQWTGVVTSIALSMLESNQVDAVVCIANNNDDDDDDEHVSWASSVPIIARTVEDVLRGRGVKPALAPSLRILDDLQEDPSIRRILFCGVGCAVQAFRVIQSDLRHVEEVFVLGTNCADNSPTAEAARTFLRKGIQIDTNMESIQGYEFMQDFKVHVKTKDSYITKPYFSLPGTIAEQSIAMSCRACFDYTNALADVVVGYMGAPLQENARMDESFQTLTIRNERGARMVQTAVDASRLILGDVATGSGSHEILASATVTSDALISAMVDRPIPETGMPKWMGEFMALGMRTFGPKGLNFARYSIDYHVLRNYLHVLNTWGKERADTSIPDFARDIVNYYNETDQPFGKLVSLVEARKF
jgi:coenzyme F420-reducing hydrogenase beta subunit